MLYVTQHLQVTLNSKKACKPMISNLQIAVLSLCICVKWMEINNNGVIDYQRL